MEETKKLYESMVIISCGCGGDGISSIIDKLKKLIEDEENAQLDSCNEWGKKKLAYPINKEPEAYYVLFTFISDSKFPAEFSRICGITDGVLRSMIVKCVEKKKKVRKKSVKKLRQEVSKDSQPDDADVKSEGVENNLEASNESSCSDAAKDTFEEV